MSNPTDPQEALALRYTTDVVFNRATDMLVATLAYGLTPEDLHTAADLAVEIHARREQIKAFEQHMRSPTDESRAQFSWRPKTDDTARLHYHQRSGCSCSWCVEQLAEAVRP